MNNRALVFGTVAAAVLAFAIVAYFYIQAIEPSASASAGGPASDVLERPYSPSIGPKDAPVTIVEFFDPACPSCRAFYPFVHRLLAQYPKDLRVVMRYTTYHKGSEEAVRILETARHQGVFVPVLEALYGGQAQWADQRAVNLDRAWELAGAAGLDVAKAKAEQDSSEITQVLKQDVADGVAAKIDGTPTFFVNGKPLPSFGSEQLQALVKSEVDAAHKR